MLNDNGWYDYMEVCLFCFMEINENFGELLWVKFFLKIHSLAEKRREEEEGVFYFMVMIRI